MSRYLVPLFSLILPLTAWTLPRAISPLDSKDQLLEPAQVQDDGGFSEAYYIESDLKEGETDPISLDLNPSERMNYFLQNSSQEEGFEALIQFISVSAKQTVCKVKTAGCLSNQWGYHDEIEVVVSKYHKYKKNKDGKLYMAIPQQIVVQSNMGGFWFPLNKGIVSTGTKGHDTPTGTFHLAQTNGGRLKGTRNHCSGVADYGTDQGQYVELAPMPYAVHFNGGIAMHIGAVSGGPRSHGCVRQQKATARATYCILLEKDNWKRATVRVTNHPLVEDASGRFVPSGG